MKNFFKNIFCTALGILTIITYTGVFADVETSVSIEDYMYDAKTVYVDDNLEDRVYPISTSLSSSNSVTEENGNTAVLLNGWNSVTLMQTGNFIDADKVVVSFNVKPTGASFEEAVSSGAFDKTLRSYIAYGIFAGGTGETGKLGLYSGTSIGNNSNSLRGWFSWGNGANIDVPQTNDENNGFVKVVAVYERVKNADSDTYSVYMRNLYFNGKDILTDALRAGNNPVANWWSDSSNATFRLQNRTGSGTLDNYYDDFLIYVPEDFKIKNMEYSDDNLSAKLKLTLGAKLDEEIKVDLISEEGVSECSVTEGESAKELVVNFANPLDLENESYYISFDGITSLGGDDLESEKFLLSEKSAEIKDVTACKTEAGINGEFVVNALEDKIVYGVMSAWNDNNCLDFKVQAVALDTSLGDTTAEIKIHSEAVAEADKVQMFFVDSIENMKIISEISEIELP